MSTARLWRYFDWWLLAIMLVLIAIGVAMIFSTARTDPEIANAWLDQIVVALIGLLALTLVSLVDYTLLRYFATPAYLVTLILLVAVLFFGVDRLGARRWFDLGGFDFQPGEIAKLTLVIMLAKVIADREGRASYLSTLAMTLMLTLPAVVLILRQPNLSTALTLVILWATTVFVGGLEVRHALLFAAVGAAAAGAVLVGTLILDLPILQPYQLRRIEILLGLEENPGDRYQIEQALIALASGGLLGEGYGQGIQTQLRFLPARHTDFIFSSIGEELGFVGSAFVLVLMALLILRILYVAWVARDTFGRLLCVGIASILFLQAVVNIGMQLQFVPVTGVVLPFVSYGRSSLLSVMISLGIVQSISMHRERLSFLG